MGLREKNKAGRRNAILDAAETILREQGPEAATMRDIARVASVSEVTPYNLFGTKAAILEGLLARHFEGLAAEVHRLDIPDPIDRIYEMFWRMLNHLLADGPFFRGVFAALAGCTVGAVGHRIHPAIALVPFLESAQRDGHLRADIEPLVVARQIVLAHMGAMAAWVIGHSTDDAFRLDFLTAVTVILLAAADDSARAKLEQRFAVLSKKFTAHQAHSETPALWDTLPIWRTGESQSAA